MQSFVAELMGTMVLILLGDGVVAGVTLNKSKAQNAGWIVITAGWAFAVMCGIFVSEAIGGPGSLNPAGTVGSILSGKLPVEEGLIQIGGQFAGAFLGAVLVWLHYLPHWHETADAGAKLGVFCTGPAIRNPVCNFISEAIGTFVLILVATAFGKAIAPPGMTPMFTGGLIWAIGLSLGGTTGYAINPARDFSPRLAHWLLPIPGKGDSDWSYAWVPVAGPLIGAIWATIVVKAIGM